MRLSLAICCLLIFSSLSQSQTNVISREVNFKETVSFEHPGNQSWIITVMTPDNQSTTYDGCNWHYWEVAFNRTLLSGSNFTLVVLQNETVNEQPDISNYETMANVSVLRNIENNDHVFGFTPFPSYGGHPQKLKVILYYGGSNFGNIVLSGSLIEFQTQRACDVGFSYGYSLSFAALSLVLIIIVRLRINRK